MKRQRAAFYALGASLLAVAFIPPAGAQQAPLAPALSAPSATITFKNEADSAKKDIIRRAVKNLLDRTSATIHQRYFLTQQPVKYATVASRAKQDASTETGNNDTVKVQAGVAAGGTPSDGQAAGGLIPALTLQGKEYQLTFAGNTAARQTISNDLTTGTSFGSALLNPGTATQGINLLGFYELVRWPKKDASAKNGTGNNPSQTNNPPGNNQSIVPATPPNENPAKAVANAEEAATDAKTEADKAQLEAKKAEKTATDAQDKALQTNNVQNFTLLPAPAQDAIQKLNANAFDAIQKANAAQAQANKLAVLAQATANSHGNPSPLVREVASILRNDPSEKARFTPQSLLGSGLENNETVIASNLVQDTLGDPSTEKTNDDQVTGPTQVSFKRFGVYTRLGFASLDFKGIDPDATTANTTKTVSGTVFAPAIGLQFLVGGGTGSKQVLFGAELGYTARFLLGNIANSKNINFRNSIFGSEHREFDSLEITLFLSANNIRPYVRITNMSHANGLDGFSNWQVTIGADLFTTLF